MKLFQTAQNEVINIDMITNIKPIHSKEIGREAAERLYTEDEYNSLIDTQDVKKCRVMHQNALWSQVDLPIVAYKVITTNGPVIISVPDYDRLIKILSNWLTDDAGEDEDEDEDVAVDDDYDDGSEAAEPFVKLTQDIFKHPDCPRWAKWAAIDSDGSVFVYATKPAKDRTCYGAAENEYIGHIPGWERTLIKREE